MMVIYLKKRGKPYEYMTSESVLTMIKRMGYEDKMVTHGFRSLFRPMQMKVNYSVVR